MKTPSVSIPSIFQLVPLHLLNQKNFIGFVAEGLLYRIQIEAMQAVGYCGCPRDAEPEIQDISNWVSSKNGGFGVIRELYRIFNAMEYTDFQFLCTARYDWICLCGNKKALFTLLFLPALGRKESKIKIFGY